MKISRKDVSKNWIFVIISLVVGFLLILAFIAYNGKNHVDRSVQYYTDFIVEDSKIKVQNEVNNRLDEIYYDMDLIECETKDTLALKITALESAFTNQEILTPMTEEKVAEFILEFENLTQTDTIYRYFVLTPEGEVWISSIEGYAFGTNLYNEVDASGVSYIQEIIAAVDSPEGIFVDYLFPKTKDGEPVKKTSYCKYIEDYDVIIGVGYYHEDVMRELQEETFQRLLSYYKNDESYIFLTTYEGVAMVSKIEGRMGKKYFEDENSTEWQLHQDIMEIVENGSGGFVTYSYFDKTTDVKHEKISYVSGIDEWEMYIGMGVYTDQLAEVTEEYREEFLRTQMLEILYTILVLMLVAFCIYFFVRRGIFLFRAYMMQEEGVYKTLFSISYEAIFVISKKGQILHRNLTCINLFGYHLEDYIEDGKLRLEPIEDAYYIFKTNRKTKYLSYREESFQFHMEEATIYFVQDMTDTVLKSKEKERLAMKDVSTGALNRRALIHDVEVLKNKNSGVSLTMAFIDLDYFKKVNDTHGHAKGDEILKLLADKFHERLRSVDKFYRYGGEEFIVAFQDVDLCDAKKILNEVKLSFAEGAVHILGQEVTFSAGVVKEVIKEDTDLDYMIHDADRLLYQAKESGRNKINIGEE